MIGRGFGQTPIDITQPINIGASPWLPGAPDTGPTYACDPRLGVLPVQCYQGAKEQIIYPTAQTPEQAQAAAELAATDFSQPPPGQGLQATPSWVWIVVAVVAVVLIAGHR